jgi:hypothetical protein
MVMSRGVCLLHQVSPDKRDKIVGHPSAMQVGPLNVGALWHCESSGLRFETPKGL